MYAAFLQEASRILDKPQLSEISKDMTDTGDLWRKVAVVGARICKGRATREDTYSEMAEILRTCAAKEKQIYQDLLQTIKS
jgi:predicted regulator of amino acid metabolism with ACT domain